MDNEISSESLQVLLTKESTTYRTNDYLNKDFQVNLEDGSLDAPGTSSSVSSSSSSLDRDMVVDNAGSTSCQHEAKKRKLKNDGSLPNCDPATSSTSTAVDEALRRQLWREKLCEWAYQVVDHFGLAREIVSITMNTFDRYCAALIQRRQEERTTGGIKEVCVAVVLDKNEVALTAMTCLSLAIKLYEYKRILIPGTRSTMETILKLGRGSYSVQQIESKEYDVLNKLQWMVHPPTPQLFLHHLLVEFGSQDQAPTLYGEVGDLATYLIEVSVLDYSFASYKPSEIALAALLNSIDNAMTKYGSSFVDFSLLLAQLRAHRTTRIMECQQKLALVHAKAAEPPAISSTSSDVHQHHMEAAPSVDCGSTTIRMASPVSVTADLQQEA